MWQNEPHTTAQYSRENSVMDFAMLAFYSILLSRLTGQANVLKSCAEPSTLAYWTERHYLNILEQPPRKKPQTILGSCTWWRSSAGRSRRAHSSRHLLASAAGPATHLHARTAGPARSLHTTPAGRPPWLIYRGQRSGVQRLLWDTPGF